MNVNRKLNVLAQKYQNLTFFNTPRYLTKQTRLIDEFFADAYHLSKKGATEVSHHLSQHLLNNIPNSSFE